MIHPTAIIDPSAKLGRNVTVGPYCIIGEGVELGDDCWLQHHVTVMGASKIGARNRFYAYGSIGQQTQDLKYAGEPTYLEIGDDNVFREGATIHRGTEFGGGITKIGSNNLFMPYTHVAHDCIVGNNVIFANCGTLAGSVTVEDNVIISGLAAVHQFTRIGRHSFVGGMAAVAADAAVGIGQQRAQRGCVRRGSRGRDQGGGQLTRVALEAARQLHGHGGTVEAEVNRNAGPD